jgi:hypothetical protein
MRGLGKRFRWKIFELTTYRIQHVGPQHQRFSEVGFREGLSSRPLVNARPITRRISLSSTQALGQRNFDDTATAVPI